MGITNGASSCTSADVIIVGAGPVGLLTALKLCLAGVHVTVVEKFPNILNIPRAIAYLPIVNRELQKLGLGEEILKECHVSAPGPIWMKKDGTVLGAIGEEPLFKANGEASQDDKNNSENFDKVTLMLGQHDLTRIVLNALESRCGDKFQIKFGTIVVGVQPFPREDGLVEIMTSISGDNGSFKETVMTAKWVVGADGAGSFVRKACCIPFEGFTWENFRFAATDIEYQFDVQGRYRPINYITDPEEWAVIARTGRPDIWRICYGERLDLPGDEASLVERSKNRITKYLPGSKEYRLRRIKPYWAHQRCAKVFRKGRIVLVGDAAHANNPIGGLGLSTGILDAAAIGNSLARVVAKNEPEALLDTALENRRSVWLNMVNPLSTKNFNRITHAEGSAPERKAFFDGLNEKDPVVMASIAKEIEDLYCQNFEEPEEVIEARH